MGSIFSFLCFILMGLLVYRFSFSVIDLTAVWGDLFSFDVVSLYLTLLSCLLWVSLGFWFFSTSGLSFIFISLSVVFSILCYCSIHALFFWLFYEMSIICLFILLVVESPYSERYIASWYLLGYIVLTSLPMLLCFMYLGVLAGSFDVRSWGCFFDEGVTLIDMMLLSVLFITKIPLPPFHVWLPIVHAEASSPVSVCLSGYVMKLGILGVCRFCYLILPGWVFTYYYIWGCFLAAILFFLAAARELDGKRWLAFLSLCHILIASAILSLGSVYLGGVAFLYCLGHGLSAGLIFLFLWLVYNISSTRNLLLIKQSVSGSLLLRIVSCACLCSACSLPPTLQFFCEVLFASESGRLSLVFVLLLYLFLFAGGLIPLFIIGCLISRHCDVVSSGSGDISGLVSLVFLVLWSFLLFLIC